MELISLNFNAVIAAISVCLLFYFVKKHYEYWKQRGIPHDEPLFILGSLKGYRSKVSSFEFFSKIYERFKGTGPFAGIFVYSKPSVVVLDLDLIKNILIKDFDNFDERGLPFNDRNEPISAHLLALPGPQWKQLRGKLTPTFTSGRIKSMLRTIIKVGDELLRSLEQASSKNTDIDVGDMLARFANDVIGTCAFGIDCNSLNDPKNEFRAMGKTVFNFVPNEFQLALTEAFPEFVKLLGFRQFPKCVSEFYTRIVYETVDFREKNNIKRNDFMDLLIDLKNKKSIRSEDGRELKALTMNEIVAQSFLFILAGHETSSMGISFALYELAQNQDIQDKLRLEINSVLQKYDGLMNYENLQEMVYLDKVINETFRKYPAAAYLRRRAQADYPTDNPKYVIPKGAYAFIPVCGIQYDPDIYPNPHVFDPERFSPEEVKKRHPMTWLPFGEGPRNCLGLRFGHMQTRVAVSMFMKNFKVSVCKDTPIPMTFSKNSFMIAPEKPIILKIEKL